MTSKTREWNAENYHRVSGPQADWGRAVLAQLDLRGDERAVDLGCGTGRVTQELASRLPHGEVLALDASRQMLEQAVMHLAGTSPRVKFVQALLPAIPLAGWADVAFSTATFHWVNDHPELFANIWTALAPGGLLHAQCGGGPNLEQARAPATAVMELPAFAGHFRGFERVWEFADDRITASRLRAAGFIDIDTNLEAAPVEFAEERAYREFAATVVFRRHLTQLPEQLRPSFLDAIVERVNRLPQRFTLDYWRLNMRARRPA